MVTEKQQPNQPGNPAFDKALEAAQQALSQGVLGAQYAGPAFAHAPRSPEGEELKGLKADVMADLAREYHEAQDPQQKRALAEMIARVSQARTESELRTALVAAQRELSAADRLDAADSQETKEQKLWAQWKEFDEAIAKNKNVLDQLAGQYYSEDELDAYRKRQEADAQRIAQAQEQMRAAATPEQKHDAAGQVNDAYLQKFTHDKEDASIIKARAEEKGDQKAAQDAQKVLEGSEKELEKLGKLEIAVDKSSNLDQSSGRYEFKQADYADKSSLSAPPTPIVKQDESLIIR